MDGQTWCSGGASPPGAEGQNMKWGRRIFVRPPALSKEKLLLAFHVEPDNPLLHGVIHVLHGMEEAAIQSKENPKMPPDERAYWDGAMNNAREAAGTIMDLVAEARRASR